MLKQRLRKLNFNAFKAIINTHKSLSSKQGIILGIETSCDDTGCAVLDLEGNILGESLKSQHLVHLNNGGIIPPIAQQLHRQNIETVVNEAVSRANVSFEQISAIATTVRPGLPMSLAIGMKYGKYLCKTHNKPFIPIHHMKAHALTARMHDKTLQYPFLVLLVSGGHCLLAVAQNCDDFLLLGSSIDDAPGEAFDKMARRMKLKNIPEYSTLSGGQAIEKCALNANNPMQFEFTPTLLKYKDCNFSVAGIKNCLKLHLKRKEEKHDVPPDGVIPDISNLCAGFQFVITKHLCFRVQRAIEYCRITNIIPANKQTLVVSGGVACNNFIAKGLRMVTDALGYKLIRPPPKLCTDNGVMIAWNGVEKFVVHSEVLSDFEHVNVEKSSPIGVDASKDLAEMQISCKWVKLKGIFDNNEELTQKSEVA